MSKKTLIKEKLKSCSTHKRCPDFDNDCNGVRDYRTCWLGDFRTGRADGYCLLIDNSN